MNGNAVNEISEDVNSKKQWEDIDNHLRQMRAWTDGTHSPLSTSPAGRSPVNVPTRVPRNSHTQHNLLYRRSEGDIQGQGGSMEPSKTANPPQSAPIIHEEFDWNGLPLPSVVHQRKASHGIVSHKDKPSMIQDRHAKHPSSKNFLAQKSQSADMFTHNIDDGNNTSHHSVYDNNRNLHLVEDDKQRHPASSNFNTGSTVQSFIVDSSRDSRTSAAYGRHSVDQAFGTNSPGNVSPQVQPPLLQQEHPIAHLPPYSLHQQTLANSPSTSRRKSAPVTDVRYNHFSAIPRRALSQSIIKVPTPRISSSFPFAGNTDIPDLTEVDEQENSAELSSGGKYDDKEYTIALLQHQTERMSRLKAEFEAKQKELSTLIVEVRNMEAKVLQRNSNYKTPSSLPSLQVDVGRLREINRKLEIDCNCMYKEVDLFSRDGDSTREDFYFRYDRNPSVKVKQKKETNPRPSFRSSHPPPHPQEADEPKWRCVHCTFDNHAALNKCEMCEFSRDVNSARTRVP